MSLADLSLALGHKNVAEVESKHRNEMVMSLRELRRVSLCPSMRQIYSESMAEPEPNLINPSQDADREKEKLALSSSPL
jgi:hypothetical protein